jgi:SAM-dependent methyltransferase
MSCEAAGLERFAELMRADGWDRDAILALPFVEDGYWYAQAMSLDRLMKTIAFHRGERLLDVGSNTCWASNHFARRRLDVVALDIATTEMQGLFTADWFLEQGDTYFERVQGTMLDIPLASATLDHVFACEVLHHNDPHGLRAAFAEIHRTLRPGGQLHLINEPLRTPMHWHRDHGASVAAFEGHEHVYFFHQYVLAARRAGFYIARIEEPPYRVATPRADG